MLPKECQCCGRFKPKVMVKVIRRYWDGTEDEDYWCTKCVVENIEEEEDD